MGQVLLIILVLTVFFTVILGIPASGLWWLSRWLRHRNYTRAARIPQLLLLGVGVISITSLYSFYFPFDSEFKHEFEQLTQLPFPASGEVLEGEISGLDLGGDYVANATIKVSQTEYEQLLSAISTDPVFQEQEASGTTHSVTASTTSSYKSDRFKLRTFLKRDIRTGSYQSISFLQSQQIIRFSRVLE